VTTFYTPEETKQAIQSTLAILLLAALFLTLTAPSCHETKIPQPVIQEKS
jgi:hypothetical protein